MSAHMRNYNKEIIRVNQIKLRTEDWEQFVRLIGVGGLFCALQWANYKPFFFFKWIDDPIIFLTD